MIVYRGQAAFNILIIKKIAVSYLPFYGKSSVELGVNYSCRAGKHTQYSDYQKGYRTVALSQIWRAPKGRQRDCYAIHLMPNSEIDRSMSRSDLHTGQKWLRQLNIKGLLRYLFDAEFRD